jgi:phenylalanine-4-hydroxylase
MPDLAHDLLGHVPMLVSEQHRQFLRRLARAMALAESNQGDHELYLANLALAELRSMDRPSDTGLSAAQARVARAEGRLQQTPSVLTQLGRLYLWSIEFGLMGSREDFRIYGAGLLSSAAELRSVCLHHAPIRDCSLAVVHLDIHFSDLQTTYFVAADYAQLNQILTTLENHQLNGTHVPGSGNTSRPSGVRDSV